MGQTTFFVRLYQMKMADSIMESRIESHNFQNKNLLEIRIPLHLPYYSNQSEFRSAKGEINLDGRIYDYVETKISNDTLYLLCLPNQLKTDINAELSSISRPQGDFSLKYQIPSGFKLLNVFDLDFLPSSKPSMTLSRFEFISNYRVQNEGKPSPLYRGVPELPPKALFS